VRARLIVISRIGGKNLPQMRLAEDDHMVQALATQRLRDLNSSATNIPSACRIANITVNDATILPYHANLGRMEFSERTGQRRPAACIDRRVSLTDERG
jgi:hypothetical protein